MKKIKQTKKLSGRGRSTPAPTRQLACAASGQPKRKARGQEVDADNGHRADAVAPSLPIRKAEDDGQMICAKDGHAAPATSSAPKRKARGRVHPADIGHTNTAAAPSLPIRKAEDDGQPGAAVMDGHSELATSSAPKRKARGLVRNADNGHTKSAAAPSLPIRKAEDDGLRWRGRANHQQTVATSFAPKRKARGPLLYADIGPTSSAAEPSLPISDLCIATQELRARHKMWLRHRIRTSNMAYALIARVMGDRGGKTEEAERKRLWSKATKLFADFLKQKEMAQADAEAINPCLMDLVRFARALEQPREALHDIEKAIEANGKELRARLSLTKPKGFGDLAFGVLVGEAGDFSAYGRDRFLWKRLGLIPFDGKAGKTWKSQPANAKRHLTAEEWTKYGYDGRRLAAVYGYLLDALFKHQWQSGKAEGTAGQPKGPYGEVYARRLARTVDTHPEWTPGHRRQDALRVMAQSVLGDCWKEWRRANADLPETAVIAMPVSTPPDSELKRRVATGALPSMADERLPPVVSPLLEAAE